MESKTIHLLGAMILLTYILFKWTLLTTSTNGSPMGQHENRMYYIDDGGSDALETKRRFQDSGINTYLSILEEVLQPKIDQIVLVCFYQFGSCGGIGDRIRGIPYAVALARLSGRQLILHRSLLENVPVGENLTLDRHHRFVDFSCTNENVEKLMKSDAEIISITVNCRHPLDPSLFSLQRSQLIELQTIFEECSVSYLCGAAAVHQASVFQDGLNIARRLVAAMPMWPIRNYTALHIRAGGSNITIDNTYAVKAVDWEDGFASDVPQNWIDVFKESASSIHCDKHLAIVSDSIRLVSELQFNAGDWLMMTRCCSQPLHRDRTRRQEFFLQEVIDLFILARSQKIIAGYGGFAVLGRYWLGRDGPEMKVVVSKEDIRSQMNMIRLESGCKSKN